GATTASITVSPASTTTYTVTYTLGGCSNTGSGTVTVNPIVSPAISCGTSTTSSVTFNWAAVSGATDYTVSYQINGGAANNIGAIGNVLTYQVTGLSAADNVTITVTPTGSSCFNSSTASCTATACTPPTVSVNSATICTGGSTTLT